MTNIYSKATIRGASFAQQNILQPRLKMFGQPGADAASKELNQLHQRIFFTLIDVASLKTKWSTMANQLANGWQEKTQQVQRQHSRVLC